MGSTSRTLSPGGGGVRVGDQEVVHELCEAGSGGGEGGARHFLHQMFH